jgi:hypothetical protein
MWKVETQIYVSPKVKCGFYCASFTNPQQLKIIYMEFTKTQLENFVKIGRTLKKKQDRN